MKKLILTIVIVFFYACNSDDENERQFVEYDVQEANNAGIDGFVSFVSSPPLGIAFFITVQLTGTSLGESYTASIHRNSLSDGGDIVFTLNDFINSENSDLFASTTNFNSINELVIDGEVLSYQDLISFDGHIKIFRINDDGDPELVLEGNIGSNVQ